MVPDRSHSFLYHGIFVMDANFQLKNLYRSTVAADPGLHTGLVYFVTYALYAKHLAKYVTQKDVSGLIIAKSHYNVAYSTDLHLQR